MQQSFGRRQVTAAAVLGLLLISVGVAALILRAIGVNVFGAIGAWGWPYFVIVPGVMLLVAALVPAPPRGVGLATAGGVVTMVGSILLYQSQTGHWESWAYAWALIPLGAGLATLLYGLLAGVRGMAWTGLTMATIAGALFLAGAWFFEGVFAGEPRPTDIGQWWPIGVMVLGGVILVRAFILPAPPSTPETQGERHGTGADRASVA